LALFGAENVCDSTYTQTFQFSYQANKQLVGEQPCVCGSLAYSANTPGSDADASQAFLDSSPANSTLKYLSFSLLGLSCNSGGIGLLLNGFPLGQLPAADFDCACGAQCVTKAFTAAFPEANNPYQIGQVNSWTLADDADYTLFTNATLQVVNCLH